MLYERNATPELCCEPTVGWTWAGSRTGSLKLPEHGMQPRDWEETETASAPCANRRLMSDRERGLGSPKPDMSRTCLWLLLYRNLTSSSVFKHYSPYHHPPVLAVDPHRDHFLSKSLQHNACKSLILVPSRSSALRSLTASVQAQGESSKILAPIYLTSNVLIEFSRRSVDRLCQESAGELSNKITVC